MKHVLVLALLPALCLVPAWGKKKPKTPTQPDVVSGCVTVSNIYSHRLSVFSGITAPEPGLEGVIRNDCSAAVSVMLTIAYFDRSGTQFGSGIQSADVAPGATYPFYHQAAVYGLERGRLKLAKIISISGYQH